MSCLLFEPAEFEMLLFGFLERKEQGHAGVHVLSGQTVVLLLYGQSLAY